MFKNQAVIERIVERCIREKAWRSACQAECRGYAAKGEHKAVDAFVKERFDAAGAGFSGRWQG